MWILYKKNRLGNVYAMISKAVKNGGDIISVIVVLPAVLKWAAKLEQGSTQIRLTCRLMLASFEKYRWLKQYIIHHWRIAICRDVRIHYFIIWASITMLHWTQWSMGLFNVCITWFLGYKLASPTTYKNRTHCTYNARIPYIYRIATICTWRKWA